MMVENQCSVSRVVDNPCPYLYSRQPAGVGARFNTT
jgi:hypothetical protein